MRSRGGWSDQPGDSASFKESAVRSLRVGMYAEAPRRNTYLAVSRSDMTQIVNCGHDPREVDPSGGFVFSGVVTLQNDDDRTREVQYDWLIEGRRIKREVAYIDPGTEFSFNSEFFTDPVSVYPGLTGIAGAEWNVEVEIVADNPVTGL